MKPVMLLDMDGTITEPRQRIDRITLEAILAASKNFNVSIVTGSDINFLMEQCGRDFIEADISSDLLPCNGTKLYRKLENKYNKIFSLDMKSGIGDENVSAIVFSIIKSQKIVKEQFNIKTTGEYLSYRGSAINWSLIGRDSSIQDRRSFCSNGLNDTVRLEAVNILKSILSIKVSGLIDSVLGGQTSIDIYPKGWSKIYALNHYPEASDIYFIGDKCSPGENDYDLYKTLVGDGKAFSVNSVSETVDILRELGRSRYISP